MGGFKPVLFSWGYFWGGRGKADGEGGGEVGWERRRGERKGSIFPGRGIWSYVFRGGVMHVCNFYFSVYDLTFNAIFPYCYSFFLFCFSFRKGGSRSGGDFR